MNNNLSKKLQLAANAFHTHRITSFAQRAACLNKAASILETDKAKFARLMTLEMGKPIKGAISEVEKCALVCRYYAENGERHLADQVIETNATGVMFTFNHWVPYSR